MRQERLYEEFVRSVVSVLSPYRMGTNGDTVEFAIEELLNEDQPRYSMTNQQIMQDYVDNPKDLEIDINVLIKTF